MVHVPAAYKMVGATVASDSLGLSSVGSGCS